MRSRSLADWSWAARRSFSLTSSIFSSASRTASLRLSGSHGLVRYLWTLPVLIAAMRSSTSVNPVSTMRTMSGRCFCDRSSSSMPVMPGIFWSVMIASTGTRARISRASSPERARWIP